ncbi:MAG: exopolysaccharide biosynthesis protein, partial [Rhizobiales bacterium]|nr:exopolysaccharide biosynthesis protein [Hyphomicrobiales bacterium]
GFDLKPMVSFLKKKYPGRDWRVSNFKNTIEEPADIVICADVVEHIPNPDRLMDFLARLHFKKLILSTPERGLMYDCDHSGPPLNPHHCREWTMVEFWTYVSGWFDIERHEITNRVQATQMMVCRAKSHGAG